ncbi:GMC oxidoreductase [Hellea balneolensis]|uniref:GMC oxidoreductase n=1 Tax=Hellea balneolensis TaxID=287478 RepID=UPI0003F90BEE|nr:GMC family oxidoreductase [Hellea balneolensis]
MADFDVIVVGSGMSGGWVAKEMCERGMKTLVLERGKDIDPAEDYSDMLDPWDKKFLDRVSPDEAARDYARQKDVYVFFESTKHLWVKDSDHPYETAEGTDYEWYRGYHVGGRSLLWARMSYRFSDHDFNANKVDGVGVDWPIRYADLKPWYDKVEKFAGVSGNNDDLGQLPNGVFLPPFELDCAAKELQAKIAENFDDRQLIAGRVANLSRTTPEQEALGRGPCQARYHCFRGCSYGAYFSSNSATLPAARQTGNLTLKPDSIVHSVIYDPKAKRATGVRVIDRLTKEMRIYTAKVVFLNASAINTAAILLQSANEDIPNGLANSSDQVGRNLMDHVAGARASAIVDGLDDRYVYGRYPGQGYIPRYRNYPDYDQDYKRGFAFQVYTGRGSWTGNRLGVGEQFKADNRKPGPWTVTLDAYAEVLPNPNNRITLSTTQKDKWGIPLPVMDARMGPNEWALLRAASKDAEDILTKGGFSNISMSEVQPTKPGNRIHEMGTARMGRDPKTSVLNKWNQAWDVENIFITDGAAMTSSAIQNPSITYMALSARAAHHAADLIEQGVL